MSAPPRSRCATRSRTCHAGCTSRWSTRRSAWRGGRSRSAATTAITSSAPTTASCGRRSRAAGANREHRQPHPARDGVDARAPARAGWKGQARGPRAGGRPLWEPPARRRLRAGPRGRLQAGRCRRSQGGRAPRAGNARTNVRRRPDGRSSPVRGFERGARTRVERRQRGGGAVGGTGRGGRAETVGRLTPFVGRNPLGGPVVHLDVTGSTNDDARALASAGAPGGTVVVAEEQTAGRGRQGRTWVAPRGRALTLSVLVRES